MTMGHRALLLAVTLIAIPSASPLHARAGSVELAPSAIRSALESSWAQQRGPDDSMEIVRLPKLSGRSGGTVHVTWPDPPVAPGPRALTVDLRVDGRIVARGLANVIVRRDVAVWVLRRDARHAGTPYAPRTWNGRYALGTERPQEP